MNKLFYWWYKKCALFKFEAFSGWAAVLFKNVNPSVGTQIEDGSQLYFFY